MGFCDSARSADVVLDFEPVDRMRLTIARNAECASAGSGKSGETTDIVVSFGRGGFRNAGGGE